MVSAMERTRHERQRRVHAMISAVGGYWRPYAGVLRLLEELGELSEELSRYSVASVSLDGISEEMADVWIISTATANQFNITVPEVPMSDGGSPTCEATFESFCTLTAEAGYIARAINYYDGPKTPRVLVDWRPLRELIPSFHAELYRLARSYNVDLAVMIDKKLDRAIRRDQGRFAQSYDPSTADVLSAFAVLQRQSPCLFAKNASLWGAPSWAPTDSVETNATKIAPYLQSFAKASSHEGLDGFVLGVPQSAAGDGMTGLAKFFAELLAALTSESCGGENILAHDILEADWQFSFANTRMFISVFSPIYADRHPRHSPDATYVFFQPEQSFADHGIGAEHDSSAKLKEAIRAGFRNAGLCYPAELIDQRLEARLYLLPRWPGDTHCEWWRHIGRSHVG